MLLSYNNVCFFTFPIAHLFDIAFLLSMHILVFHGLLLNISHTHVDLCLNS